MPIIKGDSPFFYFAPLFLFFIFLEPFPLSCRGLIHQTHIIIARNKMTKQSPSGKDGIAASLRSLKGGLDKSSPYR
jgi:hypothetical protein